jgi:hypothetical protein
MALDLFASYVLVRSTSKIIQVGSMNIAHFDAAPDAQKEIER